MFKVQGRIWMEADSGVPIGAGRITLLEKIQEKGSITVAAKEMKMSYRQAWEQVDSMNKMNSKPLVVRVAGGKGGGGTLVTKEGEKVIAAYNELLKKFNAFKKLETKEIKI
jgi:molybdate transport system regulatory protein